MNFTSVQELLEICEKDNLKISQVMKQREIAVFDITEDVIFKRLATAYEIMREATKKPLFEDTISMGGLIGGEAKKFQDFIKQPTSFGGDVINKATLYALAVAEVNASMGLIVAAPTAGASGVLPGCLVALEEVYGYDHSKLLEALLNASAIGYLIMRNANVSGAQGGCQAEVGSAAAMAASAVCELFGGTPLQCTHAATHAIMNLLGLVCDPIRGLVEVPCQTRNVIGATNALVSAQLALSGIPNLVSLDDMIDVMDKVGKSLPVTLRETGLGGSAVAPSVCKNCG